MVPVELNQTQTIVFTRQIQLQSKAETVEAADLEPIMGIKIGT
jgi:hypothetical protein